METYKGEFATPLFLFVKKSYICSMTLILLLIFIVLLDVIPVPQNADKKWEMKQEYVTQKYTTSWDELPLVFV
jgi:hypothetical protein